MSKAPAVIPFAFGPGLGVLHPASPKSLQGILQPSNDRVECSEQLCSDKASPCLAGLGLEL